MKTKLPRLVLVLVPACIVCGGAIAYAQTQAATTTDTLVGSALSTLGNAVSTLRSEVALLQTSERAARATITSAGTLVPPTGPWISRIDHPETGTYAFTFGPGVFTAIPTCVTTAYGRHATPPAIQCFDVTTTSMVCQSSAGGAPVNTGISLVCAGW